LAAKDWPLHFVLHAGVTLWLASIELVAPQASISPGRPDAKYKIQKEAWLVRVIFSRRSWSLYGVSTYVLAIYNAFGSLFDTYH
jgi:hypothetical protein